MNGAGALLGVLFHPTTPSSRDRNAAHFDHATLAAPELTLTWAAA